MAPLARGAPTRPRARAGRPPASGPVRTESVPERASATLRDAKYQKRKRMVATIGIDQREPVSLMVSRPVPARPSRSLRPVW